MSIRRLILFPLLAFAGVALAKCGVLPTFLHSDSGSVIAGEAVTYEVGISESAPFGGQIVTITPDDPADFSSIPSTVTVPQGETSAEFEATTDEGAMGFVKVSASCNGVSKDCQIIVIHQ